MELIITFALLGFFILFIVVLIPIIKAVAPIYPYSYTNARIRAMRKELLSEEEYEDLLKKPYNEILYALGKKNYPDLTKELGPDLTYAHVETAFRNMLIKTIQKLLAISPEQSKPYLKAYLSKYDIILVESLVRTTTAKYEHKRDIYHETALFSKDFLTKERPTIDDVYNQLKNTPYEPILAKHMTDIKKGVFKAFEEELDLLFFKRLLAAAKTEEARAYTKMLIDHHNISLALKGLPASIPGGKVARNQLDTNDPQAIAKRLENYGYTLAGTTPEHLERDLGKHLRKKGKSFEGKNPLSEATIIGYLILKTTDIRAINILLKGKYHNVPEADIKEANLL